MILTDEVSGAMQQIAIENSDGGEIDQHWEGILPEVIGLFKNEIFLAQHRLYIDNQMNQSAFKTCSDDHFNSKRKEARLRDACASLLDIERIVGH